MREEKNGIGITVLLIIVIVLFGVLLIPINVLGESGTDTIDEDYYATHKISFTSGKSITIKYTMDVTDGPNIDVYFLDSQNYAKYQNLDQFEYFSSMSEENTIHTSKEITLTEHDTYYLVFDNTDIGTDPPWNFYNDIAYINYDISTNINYWGEAEDWYLLLSIVLILIVVVVIMILVIKNKKKKKSLHPEQPSSVPKPEFPIYTQPQITPKVYCHGCGKKIPEDGILCPYCGRKQMI